MARVCSKSKVLLGIALISISVPCIIWVGIKGHAHPNLCNNHVHQPAARNLGPHNHSGPPVSGRLGVNYFPYKHVARIADLSAYARDCAGSLMVVG